MFLLSAIAMAATSSILARQTGASRQGASAAARPMRLTASDPTC
jgi:hypothetical protein